MNNMLTLEEVKNYLEADQNQVEDFIKRRKLSAYKIGGTYLRFRKEEVLNLRSEGLPRPPKSQAKMSVLSRVRDFWRFNNFYIISLLVVIALAVLAVRI